MTYKIFFAWQSQNKTTATFIKAQIRQSIESLIADGYDINLIERPTQENSGSPNINMLIWEQITDADVFIADVSDIKLNEQTKISNPNVMYELGIADALLGNHRTILLCDEHTKIEELAFDINHNRVSKINTSKSNLFVDLAVWIENAIIESDKDRYTKTFAIEEFSEDLTLLTNYFYCLSTPEQLSDEPTLPNINLIKNSLSLEKYSSTMINVNFNQIINCLEEKISKLYSFSNKKMLWLLMNIIKAIKNYQFILNNTGFNPWEKITGEEGKYMLTDANSFSIKTPTDITELRLNIYLNSNITAYSNQKRFYITDKRIISKCDFDASNITLPNGQKMTIIKTDMYKLKTEWVEVFAACINDVFYALVKFFDFCDIKMCLRNADGNNIGVILFEKK